MTNQKNGPKPKKTSNPRGSWKSGFERVILLVEIFKQNDAQGLSVNQIHERLQKKGIDTTKRSTQRFMLELEESKLFQRFPLAFGRGSEALWTLTPKAVDLFGMPPSALLNINLCKTQSEFY